MEADDAPSPVSEAITAVGRAFSGSSKQEARVGVGLAPPPGWMPPHFDASLPAGSSGGYALAFPAARPESVLTGQGARRVPLVSESWPVAVERRIVAAKSPHAYLVADLKNPSQRALPAGNASLFVGADPAGTARLKLVAPNQSFTLPLGIDRALKPVRNVDLIQAEKGLFSKDDIGEYVVSIEVSNPYPRAITLHVLDQVPVTDDEDVEIKFLRAEPKTSSHEQLTGKLEWRLNVPASGKAVVKFAYSLKRPKGYRMRQGEGS